MIGSISPQSSQASATSLSLLEKARQNDGRAWEKIVQLYAPLVYRWCRRAGMSYHDIENLSQEAFTLAYRKLARFRKEKETDSFRGWLYTLVRNLRIDWLRKREGHAVALGGSNLQMLENLIPDEPDEDELDTQEKEELFLYNKAVELLQSEFSSRDQQIIEAILFKHKNPTEVAAEMNISRNTVYIVKSRALRKLREEFAELFDVPAEAVDDAGR